MLPRPCTGVYLSAADEAISPSCSKSVLVDARDLDPYPIAGKVKRPGDVALATGQPKTLCWCSESRIFNYFSPDCDVSIENNDTSS